MRQALAPLTTRERLAFLFERMANHLEQAESNRGPNRIRDRCDDTPSPHLYRALLRLGDMAKRLLRRLDTDWPGDDETVFARLVKHGILSAREGTLGEGLISRRESVLYGESPRDNLLVLARAEACLGLGRALLHAAPNTAPAGNGKLDPSLASHAQDLLALAGQHRFTRLRVYGSLARGAADRHSDVDLLVEPMDRDDLWERLYDMECAVQGLLGRPVDLHTEEDLIVPLKARILQEAVELVPNCPEANPST